MRAPPSLLLCWDEGGGVASGSLQVQLQKEIDYVIEPQVSKYFNLNAKCHNTKDTFKEG